MRDRWCSINPFMATKARQLSSNIYLTVARSAFIRATQRKPGKGGNTRQRYSTFSTEFGAFLNKRVLLAASHARSTRLLCLSVIPLFFFFFFLLELRRSAFSNYSISKYITRLPKYKKKKETKSLLRDTFLYTSRFEDLSN